MPTILQKIDKERTLAAVEKTTEVEKSCLIALSKDAPHAMELPWCKGRQGQMWYKKTLLILEPGGVIQQPLDKARAWFGPFDRFAEYETLSKSPTTDEKVLDVLRDHISIESARYLNMYDYPRGNGRGIHPDMNPVGPHRSPDVTITILNADGSKDEPIRLHEVYGVGEFDPLKDSFRPQETEEQIRARFDAQLREKDAEVAAMRRELAQLAGMVKGAVLAGKTEAA